MAGTAGINTTDEQIEALNAAVRRVVKDLQAGRYSLAELSVELGSAENRLSRFVNGSRDLKVGELLSLLEIIHIPVPLFLALILAQLPELPPAATIEYLCLTANAPPVPFLVDLEGRLKGGGIPTGKGSRVQELAELDDIRFLGALAARRQLEEVCRDLATDVGAGSDLGQLRQELGYGIGLWATISRTLGEKKEAAKGLAFAFGTTQPSDLELTGVLKQRTAYVLADFGHLSFALGFVGQAAEIFAFEGHLGRLALCLVDRAILSIKKGDWEAAESALQSALSRLPTTEWRNRVAAFHSLATCCERRGDMAAAQNWLDKAAAEYSSREDGLLGQLLWAAGRHAFLARMPEEAVLRLNKAVRILSELGQPFEAELALLDLIEVRFSSTPGADMRGLGQALLGRLSKCSHSRIATDALIALGNELVWGTPTLAAIKKSRNELARAGGLVPPPAFSCR